MLEIKRVIICVDDEKIILNSLKRELKNELGNDYEIEVAESGEEAMELVIFYKEKGYEIPLIISDYIMPHMRGDELLIKLHKISPDTIKIMLTGQASLEGVTNALNEAKLYRFIEKPWKTYDLIMTVNEGIKSFLKDKYIEEQNKKLKDLNEQLQTANIQLEEKVEDRTSKLLKAKEELEEMNKKLEAEKEALRVMAITDYLTGIHNRLYVLQSLSNELNRSIRYKTKFCILLLDIDLFKNINDTYGHLYGDDVLKQVTKDINSSIRECDILGRYGGEEFLVLLPHTELEESLVVAKRIKEKVSNTEYDVRDLKVTVSGGIIEFEDGMDEKSLLIEVDELLYNSKHNGRNQIKYKGGVI